MALSQPGGNPYVGPRTFETHERHLFFGRTREARELLSLVIAERLVLFYAQSGAGKSSLINTQLIPDLQIQNFEVLPVGRVSGMSHADADVANIFVYNCLISLHQADTIPARLAHLGLADFLDNLVLTPEGRTYYTETEDEIAAAETVGLKARALIIDQFEEIFTTNLSAWEQRTDFFEQLRVAMLVDPYLWVVLVIREDYIAGLDPYAHLLPGQLRARYYMQRMGYEAALEAVKKPAEQAGRPFASGVAESLVDNLRQIRVPGQPQPQPGQFIEPVQLQVVCYQLWENLKGRPVGEISSQEVQELGNVDMALAEFYEQALAETMAATGVSEIELRRWFDEELMTEAGTRGTVFRGLTHTGGLPNEAVEVLAHRFLLRAEVRTGSTWYELVHDRFVEPIHLANQRWRLGQPLIQLAQGWLDSGRSESLLLEGQPLQEALATNWHGLGPQVEAFLTASQAAQQVRDEAQRRRELETAKRLAEEAEARRQAETARAEIESRAAARRLQFVIWLTAAVVVALAMAIIAGILGWRATQNESRAESNAATANAYATESAQKANEAINEAIESAKQANEAIAQQTSMAQSAEAAIRLANQTAVVAATAAAQAQATLAANLAAQLTVQPSPTPLPLPTPTNPATSVPIAERTATPDLAATATVLALATVQAQLSQVQATQTAAAKLPTPSATPTAIPQPTRVPVSAGKLIYVQGGSPGDAWQHALAVISANGATLQNLILYGGAPAWSPDGNWVAFVGEPGITTLGSVYAATGPGIWLIDIQGQNPRQLVKTDNAENLAWSPDGTKLACEIKLPGQRALVVIIDPRDGRELYRFLGEQPAWHPDSQRLAIRECSTARCGLWQVNFDGGGAEQITAVGTDFFPAWAPDGQSLAFTSQRDGPDWEIYLLRLSEDKPTRLTSRAGTDITPVFSPDGQEIYFRTDAFGGWRINAIDLDTNQERLVREGVGPSPTWGMARPSVQP